MLTAATPLIVLRRSDGIHAYLSLTAGTTLLLDTNPHSVGEHLDQRFDPFCRNRILTLS